MGCIEMYSSNFYLPINSVYETSLTSQSRIEKMLYFKTNPAGLWISFGNRAMLKQKRSFKDPGWYIDSGARAALGQQDAACPSSRAGAAANNALQTSADYLQDLHR